MRIMKRNKRHLYYALYKGKKDVVDEDGNYTGEYDIEYSDPVEIYASISASTGQSSIEQFGNLADYDKVIVTDDMKCPIDENSILWIERPTSEGHNYIVKKRADSLNYISFAVKKVEVKANV